MADCERDVTATLLATAEGALATVECDHAAELDAARATRKKYAVRDRGRARAYVRRDDDDDDKYSHADDYDDDRDDDYEG